MFPLITSKTKQTCTQRLLLRIKTSACSPSTCTQFLWHHHHSVQRDMTLDELREQLSVRDPPCPQQLLWGELLDAELIPKGAGSSADCPLANILCPRELEPELRYSLGPQNSHDSHTRKLWAFLNITMTFFVSIMPLVVSSLYTPLLNKSQSCTKCFLQILLIWHRQRKKKKGRNKPLSATSSSLHSSLQFNFHLLDLGAQRLREMEGTVSCSGHQIQTCP